MDNYSLRRVSKKDENLILLWANDKDTRESSFNSEIIKKSEHNKWLKKKLEDLNTCMWIFEHNHIPSGLVRFEKINDDAVLNYQISPDKRRKGFASIMLNLAIKEVRYKWSGINILAYTLGGNIASQKSLESVGFHLQKTNVDRLCYIYNK